LSIKAWPPLGKKVWSGDFIVGNRATKVEAV